MKVDLTTAAQMALDAIEAGCSFDHLDKLIAPTLRMALYGDPDNRPVPKRLAGPFVPLTDDQLLKIIEEQSRLTGWKVPPTLRVARAVEEAHGIR